MHMLRWMCGHTMIDRIRNQKFREKLGVVPLSAKMRENKEEDIMRRIESIIVEGKRSRRKPRRTWEEYIKRDMHELQLSEDLTKDKGSWRRLIHILDH